MAKLSSLVNSFALGTDLLGAIEVLEAPGYATGQMRSSLNGEVEFWEDGVMMFIVVACSLVVHRR